MITAVGMGPALVKDSRSTILKNFSLSRFTIQDMFIKTISNIMTNQMNRHCSAYLAPCEIGDEKVIIEFELPNLNGYITFYPIGKMTIHSSTLSLTVRRR